MTKDFRRSFVRTLLILVCGSPLLIVLSYGVSAKATPVSQTVVYPDPTECLVGVRSIGEIVELIGSSDASPEDKTDILPMFSMVATIEAKANTFSFPAGEPADAETIARVEAAVCEFYACHNSGNARAVLALVTDDALRRFPLGFTGFLLLDQNLEGASRPSGRWGYAQILDVQRLADGRIGVLVQTVRPVAEACGLRDDYVIFREEQGRLLIDDLTLGAGGQPLTGERKATGEPVLDCPSLKRFNPMSDPYATPQAGG